MSAYDVIVIGGGAPGEHCAGALAALGQRVALVDRALVGGIGRRGVDRYHGAIEPSPRSS